MFKPLFALLPAFILRRAQSLRFPQLFLLMVCLFVIDLVVPDVIPLLDELLLGIFMIVLGSLKRPAKKESLVHD
ncbi:MAG: hypothetical protein QM639_00505 [Rhodocyclaceae bacterium]